VYLKSEIEGGVTFSHLGIYKNFQSKNVINEKAPNACSNGAYRVLF